MPDLARVVTDAAFAGPGGEPAGRLVLCSVDGSRYLGSWTRAEFEELVRAAVEAVADEPVTVDETPWWCGLLPEELPRF